MSIIMRNKRERLNKMNNNDNFNDDEKRIKLKGKNFLAICAVCLIAIGAASWAAYSAVNTVPMTNSSEISSNTVSRPDIVSKEPIYSSEPIPSDQTTSSIESNVEETPSETEPSVTNPPPVASFFIMPISAGSVYKGFSNTTLQYSNTYDDYRLHAAVDITSEKSKSVTSCGEGIVTDVFNDSLYGWTITIDHGNGVIAKYCGFDEKVRVKVGDIVSSTTVLGEIGVVPCESLDASHIHLEFTKNGTPVSPIELFN